MLGSDMSATAAKNENSAFLIMLNFVLLYDKGSKKMVISGENLLLKVAWIWNKSYICRKIPTFITLNSFNYARKRW